MIGVIVDFDGGGRYRCEMTDARADELAIGGRVDMTFRRIYTRPRACTTISGRPVPRAGPSRQHEEQQWRAAVSVTRWPSSGWAAPSFGELWDKGIDDLLTDAAAEAAASAGLLDPRHRRLLAGHHDLRGLRASRSRGRSSSTTSR